MKTKLFSIAVIATCFATMTQAQQKFNVQNGTKTEFYDDLGTAVQKAVSGDTIYLPGGIIKYSNDELIIDKKLALIGAGCDIDSIGGLQRTELRKNSSIGYTDLIITFGEGSNGSLITGCVFGTIGNNAANLENITIYRNYINYGIGLSNQSKNIFIRENVINGGINGGNATNCWINNNLIFGYHITYGFYATMSNLNNSYICNNVIYNSYSIDYTFACTFENNYIGTSSLGGTNCTFNHNAFIGEVNFPYNSNAGSNNLINQQTINTFQGDYLNYPKNLQIREDSPCKNAGTDGTDIGIFGSSTPYMAIPFNPHIEKAVIGSQTDNAGNLKVDIKVSARNR